MSARPAPLVPAEVTFPGNDFFPLYFHRLPKSKWWRRASDLARARNVMLWCAAYQQAPAGSLADDDDDLADAAGFGMDTEAFLAVKAEIMAPWTLCSDGRWYHPTLCEVVLETWDRLTEKRRQSTARKQKSRASHRATTLGVTRDIETPAEGSEESVTRDRGAKDASVTREIALQDKTRQDRTEGTTSLAPPAANDGLRNDAALFAIFGDPGPDDDDAQPDPSDRGAGPLLTPPEPPAPKVSRAKPRRARGAPEDWSPRLSHEQLAWGLGLNDERYALELAKFRDHEFQSPRTDWDKTFNNWLRKAAESLPRGSHDRRTLDAERRDDNLRRALTAPSLVAGRGAS